jgi:dihydroorotate dehydrogenase
LGLQLYLESGVDFFEVNESCPNTESQIQSSQNWGELMDELALIVRRCAAPVLIKWSVDVDPIVLPRLLDRAWSSGFRGVVLGNTSAGDGIGMDDFSKRALMAFRSRAGGGLSGLAIAEQSQALLTSAVQWRRAKALAPGDFAIVSVGGILSEADMKARLEMGADLCQTYTGLFVN